MREEQHAIGLQAGEQRDADGDPAIVKHHQALKLRIVGRVMRDTRLTRRDRPTDDAALAGQPGAPIGGGKAARRGDAQCVILKEKQRADELCVFRRVV